MTLVAPVAAPEEDEPVLCFRPVFRSATGEILALEAVDGIGGVLEAVCRQARAWERAGIRPHLAFEASPAQLRRPGFADRLGDEVRGAGLHPSWFTVEITDSAAVAGDHEVRAALDELHDHGFRIALTDVGADYASLARWHDLPIDELEIGPAFLTRDSLTEVDSQDQLDGLLARRRGIGHGFRRAAPLRAAEATMLLRRTPRAVRVGAG